MNEAIDLAVRAWGPRVADAAVVFEARWTRFALAQLLPERAVQFEQQVERYREAMTFGSESEIETEAAQMCRAYSRLAAELTALEVPDDAYMVGRNASGEPTVAIGTVPASAQRVREVYGPTVQWYSPDDVAALVTMHNAFTMIQNVKSVFPGAEIVSTGGSAG